ncbi:MAG: hypothetical protein E6G51_04410 [Actinobacteria bacterium]|nr:MAG: hypothetical protein E6G51_04410 [Actinomycetota bacterium]
MPAPHLRNLIRTLTFVVLSMALAASAAAPMPQDVPDVAFGQAGLYRLEVALLVFYSGLLLVTPAFSGLVQGRLPIEISTRGAKFAGQADESVEAARVAIERLERITDELTEELGAADLRIKKIGERHG